MLAQINFCPDHIGIYNFETYLMLLKVFQSQFCCKADGSEVKPAERPSTRQYNTEGLGQCQVTSHLISAEKTIDSVVKKFNRSFFNPLQCIQCSGYRGENSTTAEEVSRFQCLFLKPNWLVWKGILPPKLAPIPMG